MSQDFPIRTGNQNYVVVAAGMLVAVIVALSPVALVSGFSPSSGRPAVTPGPLSGTVATPPPAIHSTPIRTTPRVQPGPAPMRP